MGIFQQRLPFWALLSCLWFRCIASAVLPERRKAEEDWLWDYTRYRFQFDGRIALNPSIRFGLGGLFFLYVVQPLLEKLGKYLGEKGCMKLASSLFFIVLIDFIGSMVYRVL